MMKRSLAALLVILAFLVTPARAATGTTNAGAFGIELCPQSICGSAIFTGILSGEVGGISTSFGSFAVSVTHDDLPVNVGDTSPITGGKFQLRAGFYTFRGVIVGGTLTYIGNNRFSVSMSLASGTAGPLLFTGILDHNPFPPTIVGRIVSQ